MILPFIKTYKKIATLFILLVIFFIYFLNKYNNILDKKNLDIFVSNQIQIIENELENQKNQALSLALMFSRNQEIVKSLENKNNIELKKELLKLLNIIETYTKNSIDVQIHTKDLEVFTRSWEDKDFGLKLDSFREGLVKVKNQKEPYVSSELGKRFNIKAIVPIYNDKNIFIGSLEVIVDFKSLVNRLKTLGIDSIVMLEKDYLKIATYHQNNQKFKDYAILESSFTKGLLDILEKNPQFLKKDKFYYELDSRIFTQIPLGEFENKSVGILLISFDKNFNSFQYLPKYDYFGDINIKEDKKDLSQQVSTAKVGDKLVLKNLHFYNRSGIFVPESRPILEELLKIMLANPNLKIEIQGHICCQMGTDVEDTAKVRALAVYNYLVNNGINKNRLSYKSFGSSKPIHIIPENNEDERNENRRVEIQIIAN